VVRRAQRSLAIAAIYGVFSQGASQVTGRRTDVGIQGDGFFVVEANGERFYTCSGSFSFDEDGNWVGAGSQRVQGWVADAAGNIDVTRPIDDLTIALGDVIDPHATEELEFGGNLSSDAAVGDEVNTSMTVFDSLGTGHEVTLTFTKTGANAWSASAGIGATAYAVAPATLTFDATGALTSAPTLTFGGFTPPGADPLWFDLVLDGDAPLVQFAGQASAQALRQDGIAIGFLSNFTIGDDGSINGQFNNGENRVLGAIATADFANPEGLMRVDDSNFAVTNNSREPQVRLPGFGTRGLLAAGTLEMSNVDLAQEFTNLIIAQGGFQANSRVITTSDELLQELVNLKR
jgi:flagellar hook protein FlgE